MNTDLQQKILGYSMPITESGCWVWIGAIKPNGYGNVGYKGKTLMAHRASFIAFIGEIPEGRQINHKCDVSCCVNPDHLYAGTQTENIRDLDQRDRRVIAIQNGEVNPMYGKSHSKRTREKMSAVKVGKYAAERHPRATIDSDTAKLIYSLKGQKTAKALSREINVSFHVIRNIWAMKNWNSIHV